MYNVCNLLGFQTGKFLHKNHYTLDILQGLEQTESISQQVYLLLTVFYYLSFIRAHIHMRNSVHMHTWTLSTKDSSQYIQIPNTL